MSIPPEVRQAVARDKASSSISEGDRDMYSVIKFLLRNGKWGQGICKNKFILYHHIL